MKIPLLYNRGYLKDNGFSFDEEKEIYDTQLEDIYENPRWYLENLETLQVYFVRWHNYRSKGVVMPYKFVKNNGHL